MSDDGSVLTYLGPLDYNNSTVAATLDGKTGTVLRRFGQNINPSFPTVLPLGVSADGRRLLVCRQQPETREWHYDVAGRIAADEDGAVAFARDGSAVAVSLKQPKPTVRVYDVPPAPPNAAPPGPPKGK
jgi:hypothetical protein